MGAHFLSRFLQGFSGPHLKPRREVRPLHFPTRNKVRGKTRRTKQMKQLMIVAVAACAVGCAFANDEQAPEGVNKVILKISQVETPSTRAEKWNPPQIPVSAKALPFTESDIQSASPEEALKMDRANRMTRFENNRKQAAIAMQQYRDAMAHFKGTKAKLEGTAFGRQILLAVDKFAGAAGECFDPDCIEFFHNMDASGEADEAALISGKKGDDDLMTAPYFIKLIFDDPQTKVMQGVVAGTEMKRTTVKIGLTYQVQALSGKEITSGNVKKEKSERETSMGGVDEKALVVDAIDEALVEVAKRINAHFVAKTTIKVIPAKKDKEFDADSATLEIDGISREIGEEISLMKGRHTITVDLDGYKQIGSIRFDIKKSGQIKIKVKKVEEKKETDNE